MSSQNFEFWAAVGRLVIGGAVLLSVIAVFGVMMGVNFSIPWFTR